MYSEMSCPRYPRCRRGWRRAYLWGPLSLMIIAALGLLNCGPKPDAHAAEREGAGSPTAVAEAPLTVVRTHRLELRTTVEESLLPAEVLPLRGATVAAEVPGVVEAMRVEEGQRVRRGQVLAEIDLRGLEQRLVEAEAVAGQRRVQFGKAEKLLERQSITQEQYLNALTARDVAEAQLASVRLELSKAQVKAPWSGTVARRRVEVGDYAQPGQALFEIIDVGRLKVRAPAPSKDVPFLHVGSVAEVTFDIFPGEVFSGEITHLAAALDPTSRTLDVEVQIDNSDGRLRPGLYARLRLPRRRWEEVILLPLNALVEMGDGQVAYVLRSDSQDGTTGQVERRDLQLGPILGSEVVVAAGLQAGDRVIVDGQHQVAHGQAVRRADTGD